MRVRCTRHRESDDCGTVRTLLKWVLCLFQSVLREGYLKEMIQVLSDPRYGSNLTQVDATVKKHEAISADILARVCDV
jgi:hypothetical protein